MAATASLAADPASPAPAAAVPPFIKAAAAPVSSAGRDEAPRMSKASALWSMPHIKEERGAAKGSRATSNAAAIPAHMSAVTRRPASALVAGDQGLMVPKASIESGAVAARAAKPVAMAADKGGGNQRRKEKSKDGPNTAIPATARYDSLKDRAYRLSGARVMASTKHSDSTASGFWGLSIALAALAIQNDSTARKTDGDGPTR